MTLPSTSVSLCGIELKSPLILSACAIGEYGKQLMKAAKAGAAAVVTQTLVDQERYKFRGPKDPTPHQVKVLETTKGLTVCGAGKGMRFSYDEWVDREFKLALGGGAPVILSMSTIGSKANPDADATVAKTFEQLGASAIELNFAPTWFPNRAGGVWRLSEAPYIISALKKAVKIPIIPKIPYILDVVPVAKMLEEAGADAIHVEGATAILFIDADLCRPVEPSMSGYNEMSGEATKPFAVRCIAEIVKGGVKIPILGSGGVFNGRDVAEYVMAGAICVEMATAPMHFGLGVFRRINTELKNFMKEKGYQTLEDLRGKALKYVDPKYSHIGEFKAVVDPNLCDACGLCRIPCDSTHEAISVDLVAHIDQDKCAGCAYCLVKCPRGAISLKGWPPAE
jgi:dihydroorotate dehydrogenase